jgi:hypothetical protein
MFVRGGAGAGFRSSYAAVVLDAVAVAFAVGVFTAMRMVVALDRGLEADLAGGGGGVVIFLGFGPFPFLAIDPEE